jgi:hypothetical protein
MTVGTFLLLLTSGAAAVGAFAVIKSLERQRNNVAFNQGFQRFHLYKKTQIALSTEHSSIKVKVGGVIKTYRLSDVRSWEKHWHNSRHQGTLTLNVRDIDHPVWTIKFGNEMNMNKWYELVSQAINEKLKL